MESVIVMLVWNMADSIYFRSRLHLTRAETATPRFNHVTTAQGPASTSQELPPERRGCRHRRIGNCRRCRKGRRRYVGKYVSYSLKVSTMGRRLTVNNSVGALAGGLAQTGTGVYNGAKDTAGMGEKKAGGITADDLEGIAKEGGEKKGEKKA